MSKQGVGKFAPLSQAVLSDYREFTARIDELRGSFTGATAAGKSFTDGFLNKVSFTKFNMGAAAASLAIDALTAAVEAAKKAIAAAMDFIAQQIAASFSRLMDNETALARFSAATGIAGGALDKFGDSASKLASRFGGEAAPQIQIMTGLVDRLGPGIATSRKAVEEMTGHVNIFSKATGLDATQSMETLTSAMTQFGVDLSSPTVAAKQMGDIMNVLAASAQQGRASIPELSAAFDEVGGTATKLNVSIVETNALLQTLADANIKGSEAGKGLDAVLNSLATASEPAKAALSQMGLTAEGLKTTLADQGVNAALEQVRGGLDQLYGPTERAAAITAIFSSDGDLAATALLGMTDVTADFAKNMTGTTAALDQSSITMATTAERLERLKAKGQQLLDNALQPVYDMIGLLVKALDDLTSGSLAGAAEAIGRFVANVATLGASELVLKASTSGNAMKSAANEAKKYADNLRGLAIVEGKARMSGEGNAKAVEQMREKLQNAREMLKNFSKAFGGTEEGKKAITMLRTAIINAKEEIRKLSSLPVGKGHGTRLDTVKQMAEASELEIQAKIDALEEARKPMTMHSKDWETAYKKAEELKKKLNPEEKPRALPPPSPPPPDYAGEMQNRLNMIREESEIIKARSELNARYDLQSARTEAEREAVRADAANRSVLFEQQALKRRLELLESYRGKVEGVEMEISRTLIELDNKNIDVLETASAKNTADQAVRDEKKVVTASVPSTVPAYEEPKLDLEITQLDALVAKFGELGDAIMSAENQAAVFKSLFNAPFSTDGWKQSLKQVATMIIDAVQVYLLGAAAMSGAKGVTSFGVTLIKDAPLIAAAWIALELAKNYLNSLAVGTNFVPQTGPYLLHKGEKVIPEPMSKAIDKGQVTLGKGAANRSEHVVVSFRDMDKGVRRSMRQSGKVVA